MKTLQILGTGCPRCKKLAENTEAAAKRLGIPYRMEKVTDIQAIMGFGVMMTPGPCGGRCREGLGKGALRGGDQEDPLGLTDGTSGDWRRPAHCALDSCITNSFSDELYIRRDVPKCVLEHE